MNKEEKYAVTELYSWFKNNQEYLVANNNEISFKDSGRNSAAVAIQNNTHVIQLCAWDHASCLDIEILEIDNEKFTLPHTGTCHSKIQFIEELDKFLTWHKNELQSI